MILFPELCLSPFFPQFAGGDASQYLLSLESKQVSAIRQSARELCIYAVPNIYFDAGDRNFDASLMIAPDGEILGISKMVHVAQAPGFFEQDYYTPSDTGFLVFDTTHGRVAIVVCFDRHFPESIRACVQRGAQLILIPTANTMAEPREWFEWEIRVAARQNGVWMAMCNRVGSEGDTTFCRDSIIVNPDGDVVGKAGSGVEILMADINLANCASAWQRDAYLNLMRPDMYS